MKKRILIMLSLLLGLVAVYGTALADEDPRISGQIVEGLRLLPLTAGPDNHLVIYRGDYVQPQIAGTENFEVTIPELQLSKRFPVKTGERAYIKMTRTGTFAFVAGPASGTIEVIEYSAPSYTAVTAEEAAGILENTNPLILDVRTEAEYRQGYIQGSNLLPVQVLQQSMAQLEPYKNRDIFIYCATGNRSTVAARLLIQNGFNKIYNLRHGIADWTRKGYPVVR